MKLVPLADLPVGAVFVRHDEYGDGNTLHVKLTNHSFGRDDHRACGVGTTTSGSTGNLLATCQVQEIKVSVAVQEVLFCICSSVGEWNEVQRESASK